MKKYETRSNSTGRLFLYRDDGEHYTRIHGQRHYHPTRIVKVFEAESDEDALVIHKVHIKAITEGDEDTL